jgi:hypothetical protein
MKIDPPVADVSLQVGSVMAMEYGVGEEIPMVIALLDSKATPALCGIGYPFLTLLQARKRKTTLSGSGAELPPNSQAFLLRHSGTHLFSKQARTKQQYYMPF